MPVRGEARAKTAPFPSGVWFAWDFQFRRLFAFACSRTICSSGARQPRLIIPASFRNDYLSALEALTSQGNADPFISFAHKLMEMNSRIPFATFDESHDYFRRTKALDENTALVDLSSLAL